MYKNIKSGIIDKIIHKIKNCFLFQKSSPSIIAKSKKANKFKKIIKVIRMRFLYINYFLKKFNYNAFY